MKLTKNFSLVEFACKDGAEMPDEVFKNIKELAENLQVLRDFCDKPITVNSGYRSEDYNKKIGGAKNSQHIKGKAADIVVKDLPPQIVALFVQGLIRIGAMKEGGIGLYDDFLHYDIRNTKARWKN